MNVDEENKSLGEPKSIKTDDINLDSSIKKNVINNPVPSSPASMPTSSRASGLPTESKLPENKDIDSNEEVPEDAAPGEKVEKGKEVGDDGQVQKSAGREIVDAGQNAAEVAAAVGSGGASAGAGAEAGAAASKAGATAGKAGAQAGSKTSNAIQNASKKNMSNPVSNKAKEVGGKVLDKAKDELADKIDKKADKNPLLKKGVEDLADKARVFNRGVDTAKSALSGDIGGAVDNLKQLKEQVKKIVLKKIKKIAITIFLQALVICILIMSVWAFIEHAFAIIDKPMMIAANTHEKLDNFLNGLGFQNSEEAFYEELKDLVEDHDYQVNIPILMATLFYDDTHSDNATIGLESGDGDDGTGSNATAYGHIYKWLRESNDTLGKDGLVYSSNKIYRLRKLVRNQFDNKLFGSGSGKIKKTVGLSTYLANLGDRIGSDLYDLLVSGLSLLYDLLTPTGRAELAADIADIILGEEVFTTTDAGSKIESIGTDLLDILKAICSQFKNIDGIEFNIPFIKANNETEEDDNDDDGESKCDSFVCITYYDYAYSEDAYFKYLRDYYIKYMPEFKKYISSTNEDIEKEQIEKIIQEIKDTSENYQDVFGRLQLNTTENYTECVGNIKESLLGDLGDPVTISGSVTLSGTNAYGTVGGKSHNGVELNGTSAGVSEGAEVYSVMDGEVLESTADDSYSDKNVKGGWLKIKYKDTSGDEGYIFDIIYGGMSKDSVTLKKDDKVTKGQVIGKVGNKDESEHGDEPGLHFGFFDESNHTYMNPTNIFIPCSGGGNTCETFKIHDTYSISEANFIKGTQDYCSSSNNSNCSIVNNLDLSSVYKTAVSNNLNPLFIFPRAFVEGFSPGNSCKNNNYWGIGCSSGHGCCINYSSVTAAIDGLGTDVTCLSSDYEILHDTLKCYAYIGTNWFNPGSSKIGGCYYYPYIKEFMTESRSSTVASACADGNGCSGSSCLATNDEDQEAYTQYQCKRMFEYIEPMYGSYLVSANADAGEFVVNVTGQTGAYGKSNAEKLEIVFPNGVPQSEAELMPYLTSVTVPITTKDGSQSTTTVTVHKAIANDVLAALTAAQNSGFKVYEIGGYRAFGSDGAGKVSDVGLVYSQHCYGLAVDINVNENCYQKPPGSACTVGSLYAPGSNEYSITTSGALYKSFISNGWGWGGEWNSLRDYMHFSFFGT